MSSTTTMNETAVEQYEMDAPASSHSAVGLQVPGSHTSISRRSSQASNASYAYERSSFDIATPTTGAQTPTPLLRQDVLSRVPTESEDVGDQAIDRLETHKTKPHLGDALENLARTMSHRDDGLELQRTVSRRRRASTTDKQPSKSPLPNRLEGLAEEIGSPTKPVSQARPPELPNLTSEIIFILVCSAGQLLFAWFLGDVNVNQSGLREALGIANTQLPWLQGAMNIAMGLSVILAGSITDLAPPKFLIVGAFAWLTVWNTIGSFSLTPQRAILFFIVRAMQGLAIGVLVSGSMSILGRVYSPGIRKTRVFSCMAAMAPFGFYLGGLQGGALSNHLPWIFGSNAILCAITGIGAYATIPALRPVADVAGAEVPSLKQFDFLGAATIVAGFICLLFGLTQGSVSHWSPYTYSLVIVGLAFLVGFFFVERRAARPLVPNRIWKQKGFTPLMIAYFLGFGSFIAWQFYAIQFWSRYQGVSPLTVALYLTPNAIMGVVATFVVSRVMHLVRGDRIFVCSMIAFALGPAFFLPQTPNTTYWALSMPGVALSCFGPDLSFAAASIFITSNVARSYQGSAGSLLVTVSTRSHISVEAIQTAV